ncbi:MAG: 2-hydroxyacyl-CoA dehydratase, partial [Candidatus Omnitrophica bacterium]|nr:2-hydroxyacyl-CoA dehydratase [Candidatus Omnitrophota bacterium]
ISSLIDELTALSQDRNAYFKNLHKPVIGWCNTYVPEEIIMAAGFIPYRVMDMSKSLSASKAYLSGNMCSSVQNILECALSGNYKFLSGMIIGTSTDATKRLYDAWIRYVSTPFNHLFDIPKFIDENAKTHYTQSVCLLVEEIEKHFKIKITNLAIEEAISICNKTRKLLCDLNNLRKVDNPPITSQQFLKICKFAVTIDKKDFNDSLKKIVYQIKPNEKEKEKDFRILLTGSFQDQSWLLDIVEQENAMVVCEDLCTRLRYFSGLVIKGPDLISNIAERYLSAKPASASLISLDKRSRYLLELIKEFRIDGVIYYILKFDDPYLFEFPDMKDFLDTQKIPVLRIEAEHNTSAMGQIETRVQAFTETLSFRKANASFAK